MDAGEDSIAIHSYPVRAHGCFGARERGKVEHVLTFVDGGKGQWMREWRQLWRRPAGRKVMVFLNPVGGNKQARHIWGSQASRMFEQAGIATDVSETKHQGHATEMVRSADLTGVHGLVCVSGDGLLVEVVNGLLSRRDASRHVGIPLGIIPAGSGNGMAASVLLRGGERCDVTCAVLAIIRGHVEKLDVGAVNQEGAQPFHSVLSVGWGLASDTDIEADSLRWVGSARFTIQGVVNIAKKRTYEGRLKMLSPGSGPGGGGERGPTARGNRTNGGGGDEGLQWRTIEGKFSMVWALNVTHAASDNFTCPHAELADGCFDVLVLRDDVKRSTILTMFLEMEKGSHIKNPAVEYYKAKEIVWEPLSEAGMLSVDGELMACGADTLDLLPKMHRGHELPLAYSKTQISVKHGLLRIFST